MLTLIDTEGLNLTQKMVYGEQVDRLFGAENIEIQCRARNYDESLELMLYIRINVARFEVGLVLLPGRTHQRDKPFAKAMLRVFGEDHKLCLEKVADQYSNLIKLHNLHQVK